MAEKRPSDWRAQWDLLQVESVTLAAEAKALQGLPADDPRVEAQEGALAALDVKKDAIAHAAWLTTARDQADVLLLAEIAWDYAWGLAGVATFPALPPDIDDRLQREVAIAYLVRGVFTASQATADGDRPHMPQLTDKDLDDLYGFADNVENAARDLRHMLSTKFHAYRLAAFEADGGNEIALKQEAIAEAYGEASSSTLANVQATIARLKDQYGKSKADEDLSTSEDDDALEALGKQISNPPSSEDVAALALIARWIGETGDGPMPDHYGGDVFTRNAWHVIEAAMRAVGLDPHKATGLPDDTPPPCPGSEIVGRADKHPAELEPARAAAGNREGRVVHELPDDLEDLVGRARDGVTALSTLWGSRCIDPKEFPDQNFAASLRFCIDGLAALLEKADDQIAAAIEGRSPG
jgi:hypothetical protein